MSLFEATLVYRMLSGAVQLLTKAPNRSSSMFCPIRTEDRAFRRNPERSCLERFRFSSNRENAPSFCFGANSDGNRCAVFLELL